MKPRRLLELWEPPVGFRLASAVATTYELQADFLEEDLLPVALALRTPAARGRDFRVELEQVLQDVEVTVFFNADRYQKGLRRSPRLDLIPLPEGRYPKLHAKIALLRFVNPAAPSPDAQIVRLVVTSANLTSSGYRSNIEVAAVIDDAPGCSDDEATAVRDASAWLEALVRPGTVQSATQFRDLRAVFSARVAEESRASLRFVGLPTKGGLAALLAAGATQPCSELTLASPFWPAGDEPDDVASALRRACGGRLTSVRLIGPAARDDHGGVHPIIPAALVRSLLREKAQVAVAAAAPDFGCGVQERDDDTEFGGQSNSRPSVSVHRELHAKFLLLEDPAVVRLAAGSFNVTRRGMGLAGRGNAEAGLLWTAPSRAAGPLRASASFASRWIEIVGPPEDVVVEPEPRTAEELGAWPTFLHGLVARRDALEVVGDAAAWPNVVTVAMRDIRSRLAGEEHWFDPWEIRAPSSRDGAFTVHCELLASWLDGHPRADLSLWPALPDLDARITWDGGVVEVPVLFEDKSLFPVVESRRQDDERSLIAWFLGLRPPGEAEEGFAHSIDPVDVEPTDGHVPTNDILSYLIRDFVHALPGVRSRLAESGLTETGLRSSLLGPRSPVALAREIAQALRAHAPGAPRKTAVATVFQLAELLRLVRTTSLPPLPEDASERLRSEAASELQSLLGSVLEQLPPSQRSSVLDEFLGAKGGVR